MHASSPDVLIVGSGATGGLAAKELTEAGLNVLVLDAGLTRLALEPALIRSIRTTSPSLFSALLRRPGFQRLIGRRQPVQSRCYGWRHAPDQFVDDSQNPYTTPADQPFLWFRSRQLGGRMVMAAHGRQYYRMAAGDLSGADGLSPAWPIQLADLDPWYARVERDLHLTGNRDGLACLPDSIVERTAQLTPAEQAVRHAVIARWPHAPAVASRFSEPGDPLADAMRTGRLSIQLDAVVREITLDESGRVSGATWINASTKQTVYSAAPIVMLCASALESTRLLLLSRSPRHPDGLGGASGVLGRYLMDHIKVSAHGSGPVVAAADKTVPGQCLYLPRFDAHADATTGRGFGVQVYCTSGGADRSHFWATSFGEMLPRPENRVTLDPVRRDAWDVPVLRIECRHDAADLQRATQQREGLTELAAAVGLTRTHVDSAPAPPGATNHECGTARMGGDASNSVLSPDNECWEVPNLYVVDGASFPSQGVVNPTLTMMALTARACDRIARVGAR